MPVQGGVHHVEQERLPLDGADLEVQSSDLGQGDGEELVGVPPRRRTGAPRPPWSWDELGRALEPGDGPDEASKRRTGRSGTNAS